MGTSNVKATGVLQLSTDAEEQAIAHRVSLPANHGRGAQDLCTRSMVVTTIALLLIGVVVCDIAMETHILGSAPAYFLQSNDSSNPSIIHDVHFEVVVSSEDNASASSDDTHTTSDLSTSGADDGSDDSACTPAALNASNIDYHSDHRFYSMLKGISPLPPLIFRGEHTELCDENAHSDHGYSYCLPISGRKDTPYCATADRMDLLIRQSPATICYASVLHLLLVEVYEELQALGKSPIITFGSLLGAVRNGSMIPFTEDADIGYTGDFHANDDLREALWLKGYHVFFMHIWRVCLAPTHPLAANLYDPSRPITPNYAVPYLDLYEMKQRNDSAWEMEGTDRILPDNSVQPPSEVTINGLPFATVHDPHSFLLEMYGADYMTPRPRGQ
ncbi:hypothetical protein BBJ28_00015930 [Nothophytophthora sp. Chile5]|nr:hypothetical protein BBJ28_00015930 [Nothophytophthora sp. Chile5]